MKINKEALRAEFLKTWDERMADYCTKQTAAVAILPDGGIVTVDKQNIQKHFCFGESGYDYEDAANMARHARTSEDYFRAENMKHFEHWINDLEGAKDLNGDYMLVIHPRQYYRQPDDCKLVCVEFKRLGEILESCGGSAFLEELPGKTINCHGQECRIATDEEIDIILEAYREAAAAHEKRVNTYLKKYGLSKVHSWTYWRDA